MKRLTFFASAQIKAASGLKTVEEALTAKVDGILREGQTGAAALQTDRAPVSGAKDLVTLCACVGPQL